MANEGPDKKVAQYEAETSTMITMDLKSWMFFVLLEKIHH